ncbi:class I SAM-dependent methyltransferase [Vibrio sp.]|nr:class I SAM-dependent methyltransferase [Vibrio sp.]
MIVASMENKNPSRYLIPSHLVEPLWYRTQESLSQDGLVYDPIAARACQSCAMAPECLAGNVSQKQLLHATLTSMVDLQVTQFLARFPHAWIINVGAGLDTRFYRLDNGLCHWFEVDISENLDWRSKLFHPSERYTNLQGSVTELSWLKSLLIPEGTPILILCEYALLDCDIAIVNRFMRGIATHFPQGQGCIVMAGDKANTSLGQSVGSGRYAHGIASATEAIFNCLPWVERVTVFSPLQYQCRRWKLWQRMLTHFPHYRFRLTPVVINMRW